MSPMGPGTYKSQKGRPPKPKAPKAPKITSTGMTPEMKRKLKEALKKAGKTATQTAKKAASKATKKMGTRTPQKKKKERYNPYGSGTMNPTNASYSTGP